MFTPAQVRKIDPSFKDYSDEEIEVITREVFELARLALECWDEQRSSNFPSGLLQNNIEKN